VYLYVTHLAQLEKQYIQKLLIVPLAPSILQQRCRENGALLRRAGMDLRYTAIPATQKKEHPRLILARVASPFRKTELDGANFSGGDSFKREIYPIEKKFGVEISCDNLSNIYTMMHFVKHE